MEVERTHWPRNESEMQICGNCLGTGNVLRFISAYDSADVVAVRGEPCQLCNEERVGFARPPIPPTPDEVPNQA